MAASTIYDVKVNFAVNTAGAAGAPRVVDRLGQSARKTNSSLSRLATFGGIAIAARLATKSIGTLKSSLIDYNAEIESSVVSSAGLTTLNIGGNIEHNIKLARSMVKLYQEAAVESTATTRNFQDFSKLVIGPITRFGGSLMDVVNITKAGVVASRALGIESGMAARDVEAALIGNLKIRDRFAKALIEPMGYTTESWNKLVRANPGAGVGMLKKVFSQPALEAMAKKQKDTWVGLISTIADNMQRLGARVGEPLFARLKSSMMGISALMRDSGSGGMDYFQNIGRLISNGIVPALIAVATTLSVGLALVGGILVSVGLLINTSSTLYEKYLVWLYNRNADKRYDAAVELQNKNVIEARKRYKEDPSNENRTKFQYALRYYRSIVDEEGKSYRIKQVPIFDSSKYQTYSKKDMDKIQDDLKKAFKGMFGDKNKGTSVTVNINAIEVSSEDPDRFAFGLIDAFQDIAKNPIQAASALREG